MLYNLLKFKAKLPNIGSTLLTLLPKTSNRYQPTIQKFYRKLYTEGK